MTNEKVTVPREVAEALNKLRTITHSDYELMQVVHNVPANPCALALNEWAFYRDGGSPDLLMRALVNGYVVEKTPEEKVREYFAKHTDTTVYVRFYANTVHDTMKATLDLLGIKIEGVNA